MWTYEKEEDAIMDALRLGRAMTYKSAAAGLDLGGGKAVSIGNPNRDKSEGLFKALGKAVASLGGIINSRDIDRLKCQIVCGAANNQLENDGNADEIQRKGILYCPDYIANAGGVINLALELTGYDAEEAYNQIERIFETTRRVTARSKKEKISTARAADLMAEERIENSRKLKNWYFQSPHSCS